MQHDSSTSWPPHRAVANLPGSLPMGGVVPRTPVHAFESTPDALRWKGASSSSLEASAQRRDIELGGLLAFVIDFVASAAETDVLIAASERMGYRDEAPGIVTPPGMRMNKSVHWVADEELLAPIFERIGHLLPSSLHGDMLFPSFSHRLNMYRYDDQDVFNLHTDGSWPGYSLSDDRQEMQEWPDNIRSGLTMLLYLNDQDDGVQGGNTRLFRPDGTWVDVSPQKGSALFFRHGFGKDSVRHMGCQVSGAVSKYVARINVMYRSI